MLLQIPKRIVHLPQNRTLEIFNILLLFNRHVIALKKKREVTTEAMATSNGMTAQKKSGRNFRGIDAFRTSLLQPNKTS
ncbi:MAG: hypothetical protein ABF382_00075 [Akkermansiaceae bacterium]